MPAQVVSFLRRAHPLSRDWSQDELAEFYRVESALLQAGMRIETDRGLSDEGDPWFAFCRADDGETFIHFARIDGRYIIAGPAYEGVAQGYDFPELVRDLISRHPLVQPTIRRNNTNIFMHPAALLIAVVGTAFFKTADAKAAEASDDHNKERRHGGASPATVAAPISQPVGAPPASTGAQIALDAAQTLTLVASAVAAMTPTVSLGKSGGPFAPLLAPPPELPSASTSIESRIAAPTNHFNFQAAALTTNVAIGGVPAMAAPALSAAEIGAWLSLAAVLQDLPKPTTAPAGDVLSSVMSLLPNDITRHAAAQAIQLTPPAVVAPSESKIAAGAAPAAAPLLIVELKSAALPDVAAVRLVRDLGSGVSQDAVLKLEQLPDVLAQLIAKGEHLETGLVIPTAPGIEIPHNLPAAAPDGAVGAPPVVAPAAEVVQTPAAPGPNPLIDDVISYFVSHTSKTEIVLNGHSIVIYDSRIMTDPDVLTRAESLTFTFNDGSSVSLIGTAVTLHEASALL